MTMQNLSLRPISNDDLTFARQMLYEAAFWRGEADAAPADEALQRSDLARYIEGWGRPGDRGLIARVSEAPTGAVWVRLFDDADHGYGYIDNQTPELSIAVAKDHRRCGIGRSLLTAMLAQACLDGVARVSLSVEKDNPARSLYASVGFVPTGTVGDAVTMIRPLR